MIISTKTAGITGGSAAGRALLGRNQGPSRGRRAGGAIGTRIAAGTKGKELNIPRERKLTMILDRDLGIETES